MAEKSGRSASEEVPAINSALPQVEWTSDKPIINNYTMDDGIEAGAQRAHSMLKPSRRAA
jgi:hypothetical protein